MDFFLLLPLPLMLMFEGEDGEEDDAGKNEGIVKLVGVSSKSASEKLRSSLLLLLSESIAVEDNASKIAVFVDVKSCTESV